MMELRAPVMMILTAFLTIAMLGFSGAGRADWQKGQASPAKIVTVDEVATHPERFQGPIGVLGRVVRVDESKSLFGLGCEDACILMPIRYKGRLSKLGSQVTAYGEVKKTEGGRYVFEAQQVTVR